MAAIKIRCSRCGKRISIDAAFAGGVCRCPYCTAINHVPLHGEATVAATAHPRAPAAKTTSKGADIPIADRVGFQGIAAIVLLVALLAMIVGGVLVAIHLSGDGNGQVGNDNGQGNGDGGGQVAGAPTNPFLSADQPSVAGNLSIVSPVVYVVHANLEMEEAYGYVSRMIQASSASLGGGRAAVVINSDSGAVVASGGLVAPSAASTSLPPAEEIEWAWERDLTDGLAAAMDLKPATVVVFARDWAEQTDELVNRATGANIRIVTVVPGASGTMAASLARLAEATGGGSRAFTLNQLSDFAARTGADH